MKHSAYVKSLHSQPHLSTEGRDRKVMLALLYQITAWGWGWGGGGGGGGEVGGRGDVEINVLTQCTFTLFAHFIFSEHSLSLCH